MRWIGLTGGIASGKSTVSRILRERGFPVVDADKLARLAVQTGTPGFNEVVRVFGPDVVGPDGELDRKKIGQLVFADPSLLAKLESIVHPRVRELAQAERERLSGEGHEAAFYDVPLLFEKKMQNIFDRVIAVVCDPAVQIERLKVRDGLTQEEAERRLAAQMPIEEKAKLADEVIRNDGTIEDLEKSVDEVLNRLGISPVHQAQT